MQINQTKLSMAPLLKLESLDHYTLLVNNAKSATEFHIDILGFKLLKEQHLCTDKSDTGEPDMLNFVLQTPGPSACTCVITEGLKEDSVFRRYLNKHGEGVHHIAYEADNIEV